MTEKPYNVRVATQADEDKIFCLMYLAHKENAMASVNYEKVWDMIRHATQRRGGVIGVIDGENGIEAMICMTLSQWWYSDEWHIDELVNFVHPACRRSTHAKHLLLFSKWFAEQMTMPLFVGVLSTHRTEAKVRLYERQITKGGAVFCHNLNQEYLRHG